jgi:hypothetical protein
MSAGIEVRFTRLDDPAIRKYLDEKSKRALNILGAVTMSEARRLIRRRKRPSKPGEPPSSPTGVLKRTIVYGFDSSTRSVVVGPYRTKSKTNVPNVLEYGGYVAATANWTPAEVGKHAPIRIARTRAGLGGQKQWETLTRKNGQRQFYWAARVKIKSEAQVKRANEILTEIYGARTGHWVIRIAPRPYMNRAFGNILPRTEAILKSKLGE